MCTKREARGWWISQSLRVLTRHSDIRVRHRLNQRRFGPACNYGMRTTQRIILTVTMKKTKKYQQLTDVFGVIGIIEGWRRCYDRPSCLVRLSYAYPISPPIQSSMTNDQYIYRRMLLCWFIFFIIHRELPVLLLSLKEWNCKISITQISQKWNMIHGASGIWMTWIKHQSICRCIIERPPNRCFFLNKEPSFI